MGQSARVMGLAVFILALLTLSVFAVTGGVDSAIPASSSRGPHPLEFYPSGLSSSVPSALERSDALRETDDDDCDDDDGDFDDDDCDDDCDDDD